ncbi:MAG: hypothetical protein QNK31_04710 [Porticoccus sp.]|nr:hypothetical protein [Porticoccus sp.]
MKARYNEPSCRAFSAQGEFGHQLFSRENVTGTEPAIKATFVAIEMNVGTLQRLIAEHRLVAEELHCLNGQSRDVVRKALLDALFV